MEMKLNLNPNPDKIEWKSTQNQLKLAKSGTKIKIMDLGWDLKIHNEIGQYLTQNQWKINENWMKFQENCNENLMKFDNKFLKSDNKFLNNFLYYPLIEIHRKSAIFDNKFIKNQWKSMKINENLAQNWEKISYFYLKIDYNLTSFSPEIQPKSPDFWEVGQHFE